MSENTKKELIEIGKGGLLPKTFDEQWRVADALHRSKMLPVHYKTPEMVFAGMQVCSELGLPPIMGMSRIYLVNGVPNLWGDLPLAICRQRGILETFEEYPIDKNSKKICEANGNLASDVFGFLCRAKRKDTNEIVENVFTINDAVRAGLTGRGAGLYKKFPKEMFRYKARAFVLKNIGSDILMGVDIMEHRHNANPDITPDKVTRFVENEFSSQTVEDMEASSEKLKAAKSLDEFMTAYNNLTKQEKEHNYELSRELKKKFEHPAIEADSEVVEESLGSIMDKLEEIKVLSGKICKDKTDDEKREFMETILEVASFDLLKTRTNEQLQDLIYRLSDGLSQQ